MDRPSVLEDDISSPGPAPNAPPGRNIEPPSFLNMPKQPLIDARTRLPRYDLQGILLDVFFEHFGSIFPFIPRQEMEDRLKDSVDAGTVLAVNTMCALSARSVGYRTSYAFTTAVLITRP
jgi:hypothetical protein